MVLSQVTGNLGANICVAHTCHCGKRVERDGLHGLSCTKSAGRFSRHSTHNSFIKQTFGSLDLPSMLEPRGLYRTDGKRPDGVTMIPWEMGKQLVWGHGNKFERISSNFNFEWTISSFPKTRTSSKHCSKFELTAVSLKRVSDISPLHRESRGLLGPHVPILLSDVEQEQRPSANGDREAIVVGAAHCDSEGERAYTGYAPHIIRNVSANVFSLRRFGIFFLPKRPPPCFCRNVRNPRLHSGWFE